MRFGLFKPALIPHRRLKIGCRKFYGRHLSGSRLAKRAGLPAPLLRLGYRHFCPVGIPAAFRVIMIARSGAVNDLLQTRRRSFCRFRCRFGCRLPLCRRVLFCRRFLCCRILCCRCGFFSGRRRSRHFGSRFTHRRRPRQRRPSARAERLPAIKAASFFCHWLIRFVSNPRSPFRIVQPGSCRLFPALYR